MPASNIFKKSHCNLAGKHQEKSFSQELKKPFIWQLALRRLSWTPLSLWPVSLVTNSAIKFWIPFICWKRPFVVRPGRKFDFILGCMGFKLRTCRFCFDLSMCLERFHAWFPRQLQRIRRMTVWRLGASNSWRHGSNWKSLSMPFHAFPPLSNIRTQNCLSISEVASKSACLKFEPHTPHNKVKLSYPHEKKLSTNDWSPEFYVDFLMALQQTSRIWGPKPPAPWPSCSLHRVYSSKLAREPSMELFQMRWQAPGKIMKQGSTLSNSRIWGLFA